MAVPIVSVPLYAALSCFICTSSKTRHLPRLARTEECGHINNYASIVGSNPTLVLLERNSEDEDDGES